MKRNCSRSASAIAALKAWRRDEVEVRRLLAALSPRGKARLKLVCGVEQRVGPAVLRSVRNNSFHYPKPGTDYIPDPVEELADAIRKNPDTEAGFDVLVPTNGPPGQDPPRTRRRYRFADQMMLSIAFGGYEPDEKKARKQMDLVHQAAEEFAELVDEIFDLYCKRRGIRSTEDAD